MPDPAGDGGGRTEHGPSSADERWDCRSLKLYVQDGVLVAAHARAWAGALLLSSMHVLVPCLANPSLTDAPNALYYCLPNHACVGKGCRRRPPLPSGSGSITRDY